MANFSEKVDKFIIDTEDKLLAVVRTSIKKTVRDAQDFVTVDTGFLRRSGAAMLNDIPRGQGRGRKRRPGEAGVLAEYNSDNYGSFLEATLARMKLGDVFFWGWTAKYAKYENLRSGFFDIAVQNFPQHVKSAVQEFKK